MTNRLEGLDAQQIRSMANLAVLAHNYDLYVECIEELSNIRARESYTQGALDGATYAVDVYKEEAQKIFNEELEIATKKAYELGRRHTGEAAEQVVNAKRDRDKYWTDRLRGIQILVSTNPTDAYVHIGDIINEQN